MRRLLPALLAVALANSARAAPDLRWDFFGAPLGVTPRELPVGLHPSHGCSTGRAECRWSAPGLTYFVLFDEVVAKAMTRDRGRFNGPLPWGVSPDDGPEEVRAKLRAVGLRTSWSDIERRRLVSDVIPYGLSDGVFVYFDFGRGGRIDAVGVALNEAV